MNIPFDFRPQIEAIEGGSWIVQQFQRAFDAITAVWQVEHNADGSHGVVRFGDARTGPLDMIGTGSPEGVITAPVGSLYRRTDGGASTTLYIKESGTAATGWRAV